MAFNRTEGTTTGILDLPDELVNCVLQCLPTADPSLRSLCLVCRRMNRLATPLLYQTYSNERPIYQYLAALTQRPELASYLRQLDILGWSEYPQDDRHEPGIQTVAQLAYVSRCLQSLLDGKVDLQISLLARFQSRCELAYIATLLCIAPRVRRLRVEMPSEFLPGTAELITGLLETCFGLQKPSFSTTNLQSLCELSICNSNGADAICLSPIFRLPALRKLYGTQCLGLAHAGLWPVRESSIKSMTFARSQMSTSYIGCLLRACKGLRDFEFEFGRINPTLLLIDYHDLGSALASQKDSLESVSITCAESGMIWHYHARQRAYSFHFFSKLRLLRISASALLNGTSVLPREYQNNILEYLPESLESLSIDFWPHMRPYHPQSYSDTWSIKPLQELSTAHSFLPHLSSIAISLHSRQAVGVDLELLKQRFLEQDVRFDWSYRLLPYPLRSFLGFED